MTEIRTNAFSGAQLTSVWIRASVRAIDDSAFAGQSLTQVTFQDDDAHPSQLETIGTAPSPTPPLERVTLPRSLKTAGLETFSDMDKLRSVHVGPNVQADGLFAAFARTPLLESIEVDAANQNYQSLDGVLYTKGLTHLATYPQAKNAGGAYAVAEGTSTIDEGAFSSAQITSLTLPSSLRSVSKGAFVGSHVTSLTLPDVFESMDDTAFWYMPKLERVDLGGATALPDSAFRYDKALAEVNFRPDLNRLTDVGDYAFDGSALVSVTLPDSVVSIGKGAFADNAALASVHLGSGVASIGESAFVEASSLASLSVSPANSVYIVEDGILYSKGDAGRTLVLYLPTKMDTDVTVPDGTVAIAHSAFVSNTSLRRVVLPDGLTRIEYGIFDGCDNLTDIVIPNSVTVARGLVNNGLDTVELGSKVTELWMTPRDTTTPRHIIVRGGNNGEFYYEGKATNGLPRQRLLRRGDDQLHLLVRHVPRPGPALDREGHQARGRHGFGSQGEHRNLRRRPQGFEGVYAHRGGHEGGWLQHGGPLRVLPPAGCGVGQRNQRGRPRVHAHQLGGHADDREGLRAGRHPGRTRAARRADRR